MFIDERKFDLNKSKKILLASLLATFVINGVATNNHNSSVQAANVGVTDVSDYEIDKLSQSNDFLDVNGQLKLDYFNYLLEQESKAVIPEKKTYEINTIYAMYDAVIDINNTLPSNVEFASKYFDKKMLKQLYSQAMSAYSVETLNNINTLINYSERMIGRKFMLVDITNEDYTAKQIKVALDKFTTALADNVRDENEEQSLINLYDYVFENFEYKADSFSTMLVGNLGNATMACNGFSKLMDETLEKLEIPSEIRLGYSHYWNVVTLDDKEITVDVTTDILLNKWGFTLGNSTEEHINNTSNIGFYSAEFDKYRYEKVIAYEFNQYSKGVLNSEESTKFAKH